MTVLLVFGEMILKVMAAAHRAWQWFWGSWELRRLHGFHLFPGLLGAKGTQSSPGSQTFLEPQAFRAGQAFRRAQGSWGKQGSWRTRGSWLPQISSVPQGFRDSTGLRSWHPLRERRGFRTLLRGDEGMTTAEYAIGTVAAAAFAGLLYTVLTGDSVTAALTSLVERALESGF